MFRIEFTSAPYYSELRSEPVLRGRITLGGFSEGFESSLSFWSRIDYEQQWVRAARHLEAGALASAFITDCYDPATANYIVWWPVWRNSELLVFQNQLCFLAKLEARLNVLDPALPVGRWESANEDGAMVSEWAIDQGAVTSWLRQSGPPN
jgi:hypothetical protein